MDIYGTDNGEYIYGSGQDDYIATFDGDDRIGGQGGHDVIYGGAGFDRLNGDAGDDTLVGGSDGDWLWGGSGTDTFVIQNTGADSGLTWNSADGILDFNRADDWIDHPVAGRQDNYVEASFTSFSGTYEGAFDEARNIAAANIDFDTDHVFLTDGQDGYLFSDLNLNGSLDAGDSGIELSGLTSVNQFSYIDII
jgi:Ca2+-binding RTX toxin-like protein